jgi:hypothetical protein
MVTLRRSGYGLNPFPLHVAVAGEETDLQMNAFVSRKAAQFVALSARS